MVERGGFEPAVSRETFAKENLGEYWGNFGLKSASILRRASRLQFGPSSVVVNLNSGVARTRLGCDTSVR
jgi:hypothetical protein